MAMEQLSADACTGARLQTETRAAVREFDAFFEAVSQQPADGRRARQMARSEGSPEHRLVSHRFYYYRVCAGIRAPLTVQGNSPCDPGYSGRDGVYFFLADSLTRPIKKLKRFRISIAWSKNSTRAIPRGRADAARRAAGAGAVKASVLASARRSAGGLLDGRSTRSILTCGLLAATAPLAAQRGRAHHAQMDAQVLALACAPTLTAEVPRCHCAHGGQDTFKRDTHFPAISSPSMAGTANGIAVGQESTPPRAENRTREDQRQIRRASCGRSAG